ncbi:hypothetical protein ACFPRL_11725 [Pseudoclavibacter helvolus]
MALVDELLPQVAVDVEVGARGDRVPHDRPEDVARAPDEQHIGLEVTRLRRWREPVSVGRLQQRPDLSIRTRHDGCPRHARRESQVEGQVELVLTHPVRVADDPEDVDGPIDELWPVEAAQVHCHVVRDARVGPIARLPAVDIDGLTEAAQCLGEILGVEHVSPDVAFWGVRGRHLDGPRQWAFPRAAAEGARRARSHCSDEVLGTGDHPVSLAVRGRAGPASS